MFEVRFGYIWARKFGYEAKKGTLGHILQCWSQKWYIRAPKGLKIARVHWSQAPMECCAYTPPLLCKHLTTLNKNPK